MPRTIAFSQAKAKLSELVDRVGKGEEFLITRHEQVVARLSPVNGPSKESVREAVERLKSLRRGVHASVREMISWKNQGRA